MAHSERAQFGHYRIDRLIGCGAMARVYRARDSRSGRWVALKVPRLDGLSLSDRQRRVAGFEREMATLARLRHPHIVEFVERIDGPAMAMALVEGMPVLEWAQHARASAREWLTVAQQVCAALVHAHASGVSHEDLRSENILVCARPQVTATIIDWGVAIPHGRESNDVRTVGALLERAITPQERDAWPGLRALIAQFGSLDAPRALDALMTIADKPTRRHRPVPSRNESSTDLGLVKGILLTTVLDVLSKHFGDAALAETVACASAAVRAQTQSGFIANAWYSEQLLRDLYRALGHVLAPEKQEQMGYWIQRDMLSRVYKLGVLLAGTDRACGLRRRGTRSTCRAAGCRTPASTRARVSCATRICRSRTSRDFAWVLPARIARSSKSVARPRSTWPRKSAKPAKCASACVGKSAAE